MRADPIQLEHRFGARNYAPLPVVLDRGEGVWLFDTAGRRYLDMMSAYSAVSFGHSHPELVKALCGQAGKLAVTSRAFYTSPLGAFLQAVCDATGMARALPMNTGAEAVETAIKAARKWAYRVKKVAPEQARIIVAKGNFAGRTTTIVGFSTESQYRNGFGPFTPGFDHAEFGNIDSLKSLIKPETAAFIVEPVQGEAGIIVPPDGYLRAAAELCRTHNVLFIADEVQTGLGRTGRLLACDHEGVQPDGLMLGKALGGGLLPVSAFLARADVMDVFSPGDHGSTFGGNPLAAAVGLAALELLKRDRLAERAAEQGQALLAALRAIDHPAVTDVRGKGLLIGLELDPGQVSARAFCEALIERGVLTKDTHGTVVRFAPPLTIEPAQVQLAVDAVRDVLRTIDVRPGTLVGPSEPVMRQREPDSPVTVSG